MTTRTTIRAAILAAATGGLLLAAPGSALANHTHVKVVGNGQCVILAEGAGEELVVLPPAVFENNPNVSLPATVSPTRRHPLHVLVHLGKAGEQNALYVYGSAPGILACSAGYVNR